MPARFYYLQKYAHLMVQLAIYHGDLTPALKCEQCGQSPNGRALDAHHTDYSNPLDVVWLCPVCHGKHKIVQVELKVKNKKIYVTRGVAKTVEWLTVHDPENVLSVREAAKKAGVSVGTMGTAKKSMRGQKE